MGESLGAWFLAQHGMKVLARNVRLEGGELDLVASDHGELVAVEVRAITGRGDPLEAIGNSKRERVRALAAQVGIRRVGYLGVRLDPDAVVFHWT